MIGLIIIGDEILSGRRQDKHLSKAIELLGERGMALSWARYVGDDPERITEEVRHALTSGDVVFSFGGIGATPDDCTRACAGQAAGRPLVLHPQARELILQRSQEMAEEAGQAFDPGAPDILQRLQMGFFPEGATILPNPYNRIPGFTLEGRVQRKDQASAGTPAYTYSTIGLYRPAMVAGIQPGEKAALRPCLERAIDAHRLGGRLYTGPWVDVGTPQRLAELNASP